MKNSELKDEKLILKVIEDYLAKFQSDLANKRFLEKHYACLKGKNEDFIEVRISNGESGESAFVSLTDWGRTFLEEAKKLGREELECCSVDHIELRMA